jgi:cell division protein FtsZ
MIFDSESFIIPTAKIKVIGIGGGGGNAVNTMIRTNIEGVDFITANTDVQALRFSLADNKIQIGKDLTKGLGAGADPDIGRDAMLEDRHAIAEALEGAHMVFVTAGMGGGTGTGGAAIAAQIAREMGALTVGVVTKPFSFEGKRRCRLAEEGIARLREQVDTLITIPNQRLLQIASPDLSMIDAFRLADNVLVNAVKGISDIINIPGILNVDFADVKTIMSSMGMALMGIGVAQGEDRAICAARAAINSPLLEDIDIEGATGILINITSGEKVSLHEVNEACSIIKEAAHEDANIIFGAVIDENITNEIRVTVIATGFPIEDNIDGTGPKPGDRNRKKIIRQPEPFMSAINQGLTAKPLVRSAELIPSSRPVERQDLSLNSQPTSKVDIDLSNQETGDFSITEQLTQLTFDAGTPSEPIEPEAENQDDTNEVNQSPTNTDHTNRVGASSREPESSESLSSNSYTNDLVLTDEVSVPGPNDIEIDMDKKLDEALQMAEKISLSPASEDNDDDLDVPSYLRYEPKDLNLS